MSILRNTLLELREKRLWPIAIALVAALIAVPVLVTTGSSSPTAPLTPVTGSGSGSGSQPVVPDVQTSTGPTGGTLRGSQRNPFPTRGASAPATSAAASAHSSSGSSPASSGSSPASSGASGTATKSPTTTTSSSSPTSTTSGTTTVSAPSPTSSIPTRKSPPAPAGLGATQMYSVSLATTTPTGGFDTVSDLKRLTVLPSAQKPMLVELGVMKGGHRVLFAVEPGTLVGGPGECIPGPINCQVLALGTGQTEELASRAASGAAVPVDLFAVTQISAPKLSSKAAATRARTAVSPDGQALLHRTPMAALPLFKYVPSLGALIDLRNLTVGGS